MPPAIDPKPPIILLIEDDAGVRRSLHLMLCAHGFDVHAHESAGLLIADPAVPRAAFLIADYRLIDSDGIAVLRALRATGWQGRALLVTGVASPALRAEALAAGYATVLEKPLRAHDVLNALDRAKPGGEPSDARVLVDKADVSSPRSTVVLD